MLNQDDFSKRLNKRIERMAEEAKEEINRMAEQAHRNIEQNFKMAMMEMRLQRLEGNAPGTKNDAPRKRQPAPSP